MNIALLSLPLMLLVSACGGQKTEDTSSTISGSSEWDGVSFSIDCSSLEALFKTEATSSVDDWTGYWECYQESNGCQGEACSWEVSGLPDYVTSESCADAGSCMVDGTEVQECSSISNTGSVSLECSADNEVVITVNGLPDHNFENYAQSGMLPPLLGSAVSNMTYTLSTAPTYSADTDIFEGGGGTYGVAVNGVSIFNQFTGIGTVAVTDEIVDDCGGHPANGTYHYHALPVCGALAESDRLGSAGNHSGLLGLSLDGFPILGPYGFADPEESSSDVVRLESCYAMTECSDVTDATCYDFDEAAYNSGACHLDKCNGRVTVVPSALQAALGEQIYAYYMTQDSTGAPAFPYQPYCYRGDAETGGMSGPSGGGPGGDGPPPQ